MRVLLVTSQFMPEVGGVPRLLWQFCMHRAAHMDVHVLSVRQQPPAFYAAMDARAPLPIERVEPFLRPGFTSLRLAVRLLIKVCRWRPDVLFCGVAYPTAIIAWVVTRLAPVPYVVYTHSEDVTIGGPGKRRLLSNALRGASGVLAVSHFTQHELARLGIRQERVTVVHPGIDLEQFARPKTAPALEPLPVRRVLLTVGRLIWRKGQDTVIRALPRIAEQVPGVHYVIVGTGPDEQGLRALAADMGVTDRVTFAGQVDDDNLAAYYDACDIFVMPTRPSDDGSEVEGFGIVYLEAAAAGKPVIGGQAGGVDSAVIHGETGLLTDPRDQESVTQAVLRLLLDPTLARRLGEKGQARVRHEFSDQRFAAQVTDVLERAARGKQKEKMTADSAFSGQPGE